MQHTVSMIIPAYNTVSLLERCVESVCAQTYSMENSDLLEIIIVDDGSTDGTGALADRLAAGHDNILVIHQSNAGSSAARNAGIRASHGDYLGFVDSDDYISPDTVKLLMEAIEEYDVPMAQVSREELAEDGTRLPDVCISVAELRDMLNLPASVNNESLCITGTEQLRLLLLHRGDASFCTRLTARSLFKISLFPEGKLNEDFYLMTRLLPHVGQLAILSYRGYHVWYRTGSNARKRAEDVDYFPPMFTDMVDNADMVQTQVETEYTALREEALRFALYQRLEYLLHIPISKMTGHNRFYREQVVAYVRRHLSDVINNRYLTKKNKIYLLLLGLMPVFTRRVHALSMKMRMHTG